MLIKFRLWKSYIAKEFDYIRLLQKTRNIASYNFIKIKYALPFFQELFLFVFSKLFPRLFLYVIIITFFAFLIFLSVLFAFPLVENKHTKLLCTLLSFSLPRHCWFMVTYQIFMVKNFIWVCTWRSHTCIR